MPNLWRSVVLLPRFWDCSRWRRLPSWIFKIVNFNGRNGQEGGTASSCEISSQALEPLPRYGDFSIFQDGGRRHIGFLKFQICNGRSSKNGRTASLCRISLKSLEPRPRYGDFSTFPRWRLPPSWIFEISNF